MPTVNPITQRDEPLHKRGERGRGVLDTAAEHDLAVAAIDGLNPMEVLGDVHADRDSLHASPFTDR